MYYIHGTGFLMVSDLHVSNLHVDMFTEVEGRYFECSEDKIENPDKPVLQGYKSVLK